MRKVFTYISKMNKGNGEFYYYFKGELEEKKK